MAHTAFRVALLLAISLSLASRASAQPSVYVSNAVSNDLSVIDADTNVVDATLPVGNLPNGLAATPDGTRVYVAAGNSNRVDVIDTASGSLIASIPTPGQNPSWVAVSPDGSTVYATVSGPCEVKVIDTGSNAITVTIPLSGTQGNRLAVSPDGSRVYVPMKVGGVEVIDTASNTVVATIPIASAASAVAFTPDGTRAYVTNDDVSVVDTGTLAVSSTIVTPRAFHAVVSPDGARVYVTHNATSALSVIDTATDTLLPGIALPASAQGLAITPDGSTLYVADNVTGDFVYVVDTATSSFVTTIGVGMDPHDVAIASPPSCADGDGDGYGAPGAASCPNGAAEDCDDVDPDVYPGAPELPGNLVDESCDGDLGPCCPLLDWKNHGQYVRCVAQDAEWLVQNALLTQDEADDLVTSAAQSGVGKKDFVPDPGSCAE